MVIKKQTTQNTVAGTTVLLNVSYDPTRELYEDFNAAFARYWSKTTGGNVVIKQSHGGSASQARYVTGGLRADVVTLAVADDIDAISEKGLIAKNWQTRLPNNSAPFTSAIVFLVRKGNPKRILDWDDLVRPGISMITPDPRTSGGGRLNYLAAWGYALRQNQGAEHMARAFVTQLYRNVSVLDPGARRATTTFAQRDRGDVLLAWEKEAYLVVNDLAKDKFEIVSPSVSILAEPPVSVVDAIANQGGTSAVAKTYLAYLYSEEGQEIAAKHYYRPRLQLVVDKYARRFPKLTLFTVDQVFGGWHKAQKKHFDAYGIFDQICGPALANCPAGGRPGLNIKKVQSVGNGKVGMIDRVWQT